MKMINTAAGAALAMAFLLATTAQAAINISTQATQNMSCTAGVCTATAQKAYLNVNDVTNMLSAGDLKVVSGAGAEDIHIQAPFSWTSTSRLTLDAQRSIEFKQPVSVAGTGALTLITNDGGTGGDYWFDKGASVSFWDTSSSLIINGQSFTLVKDIKVLAADIAANPSGNFALANSYDASVDGTYSAAPVSTAFKGVFEGLGNAISQLKMMVHVANADTGLFAELVEDGTVRDVRLVNPHVNGDSPHTLAALVGWSNPGVIKYGEIRGGKIAATGNGTAVGALVGMSDQGDIAQSRTSTTVSITTAGFIEFEGGFIGLNNGSIESSSSSGKVENPRSSGIAQFVGGFAGDSSGSLTACESDAAVTVDSDYAVFGGLIGLGGSNLIMSSHARGLVTGAGKRTVAGGFAGILGGGVGIRQSFATGPVIVPSGRMVGGLVGQLSGPTIATSFATGSVTGGRNTFAGSLVGENTNDSVVEDSYAIGSVTGDEQSAAVGGLVGAWIDGRLERTYSIGSVTGPPDTGGLLGLDRSKRVHIVDEDYWDAGTSGTSNGCGSGDCTGITGLSDTQLKSALPDGFDPQVWGQSPNINNGYPYLLANPPPKGGKAIKHRRSGPSRPR